jgi:hypothetical protein
MAFGNGLQYLAAAPIPRFPAATSLARARGSGGGPLSLGPAATMALPMCCECVFIDLRGVRVGSS